jgi:hypothetical protein
MSAEFQPWPKIARLNRRVLVTEKIDGTNAAVLITPLAELDRIETPGDPVRLFDNDARIALAMVGDHVVFAQSRTRFIAPGFDNHGFAAWVARNAESLVSDLGPGRHFGEWWGSGIQRGYGLAKGEKRFALFNVDRFRDVALATPGLGVVPLLMTMPGLDGSHADALAELAQHGSVVSPGFMQPEGIVVYSTAGNVSFKVTLEKDEAPKSSAVSA